MFRFLFKCRFRETSRICVRGLARAASRVLAASDESSPTLRGGVAKARRLWCQAHLDSIPAPPITVILEQVT